MNLNLSDSADIIIVVENGAVSSAYSTSGLRYRVAVVDLDTEGDDPSHAIQLETDGEWVDANIEIVEAEQAPNHILALGHEGDSEQE